MSITIENIILIGSLLVFISVLAGKTSFRFGVPTLVFFLAVGMLAGSDGIGKISFNDPGIAQFIGVIALNFILFSGGFETDWIGVKPVAGQAISLSVLGVLITAGASGIFVWWITDFTIYEGLLLGSIISSTDAAAVFSILRSKNLALKGHIRSTLEFESGSNDPMAYILTIIFTGLVINSEQSLLTILPFFFKQLILGGLMGFACGFASRYVINRIKLDYEGLYPVLSISLMFMTYALTTVAGGNGFLAVYLSALYLGNKDLLHKRTIMKMYDGLAWLMQIILFLTLGLLVFPSQIVPVIGIGLLISLFLIIVARPLAVFICLSPFRMLTRVKGFISWVGLRGAVPIVFATFPLMAGVAKADMIFNIVFFISLTSVIIQGTSIPKVAKLLHVSLPARVKSVTPADILLSEPFNTEMAELTIAPDTFPSGLKIIELGFPQNVRIALLKRGDLYLIPDGSTIIEPGDKLIIIATTKEILSPVLEKLMAHK
ncbi:MAG: potassium/proton antiporter [Bacteroidales bacterium]|jgi:cell volume regulation protein A|nr:potassium/proton antiporter [Bacteroidales bacterium]